MVSVNVWFNIYKEESLSTLNERWIYINSSVNWTVLSRKLLFFLWLVPYDMDHSRSLVRKLQTNERATKVPGSLKASLKSCDVTWWTKLRATTFTQGKMERSSFLYSKKEKKLRRRNGRKQIPCTIWEVLRARADTRWNYNGSGFAEGLISARLSCLWIIHVTPQG